MNKKEIKTREPNDNYLKRMHTQTNRSPSILTSNIKEEILYIRIENIKPFQGQTRYHFNDEELTTLADTIKSHGVRQPLTILPVENEINQYEVVSGERRLRAAKLAGLEKVPVIMIHDRKKAEEISLIENIHRKDLHPIELGKAYNRLLSLNQYSSMRNMASKIGVNTSQIVEYKQFSELPESVITKLLKHNIYKRSFLRSLVRLMASPNGEKLCLALIDQEISTSPKSSNNTTTSSKKTSLIQLSLENNQLAINMRGLKAVNKNTLFKVKDSLQSLIKDIDRLIKEG